MTVCQQLALERAACRSLEASRLPAPRSPRSRRISQIRTDMDHREIVDPGAYCSSRPELQTRSRSPGPPEERVAPPWSSRRRCMQSATRWKK